MDNTFKTMREDYSTIYINDLIIDHLKRFTSGEAAASGIPWGQMRESLDQCRQQGIAYMSVLHRLMEPYYEMYFYGEPAYCRATPGPERCFMEEVIGIDDDFCLWASNQNLIAAAEGWGRYLKTTANDHVGYFFRLLSFLVTNQCHLDWKTLSDQLNELLFLAEAYSDFKTDELYCILHALAMIMRQDWAVQKQKDMFYLLSVHWGFMKHVYTMMLRHTVGCKLSNYAAVANNVMQSNGNLPHLDIFYCVLVERMDSLGLDEKKYKKLDDARMKLLEKINRREPSEALYELCDTLFPEEFQTMMRHRPKSYGELKEENTKKDKLIKQMENQTKKLEQQLEEVTLSYKRAVEASIPVEDILQRLQTIPLALAWDIYAKLDRLLKTHRVWREYDIKIHEALEQRERNEDSMRNRLYNNVEACANKPSTSNYINNFNNQGGTFNDYSDSVFSTMPLPYHQNNPKLINNDKDIEFSQPGRDL